MAFTPLVTGSTGSRETSKTLALAKVMKVVMFIRPMSLVFKMFKSLLVIRISTTGESLTNSRPEVKVWDVEGMPAEVLCKVIPVKSNVETSTVSEK